MGNLGSLYVQSKRKETVCPVVSLSRPLKMPTEGRPPQRAWPVHQDCNVAFPCP